MPINPNIALSFRNIELQDPLAQYGKVATIQNAQQQNALARMEMAQAERELATTNALNQAYKNAYSSETGEFDFNALRKTMADSGYGSKLPEIEKKYYESRESKSKALKGEAELFDTSMKQIRDAWGSVRTVDDALAIHNATHSNPVIEKRLRELGVTEEMGRRTIMEAAKDPAAFSEFLKRAQLGAEEFIKANKPNTMQVNRGGRTDVIQIPGLGGAPTPVGTYAEVPLPADVQAQKVRIAQAGATVMPPQEKAFEVELGQGLAKDIVASKASAQDAAQILETNQAGRQILQSGAITGSGANFFVGFNNALKQAGIDAGYADAAANSQAYAAAMATNTAKLIKAFGAGTGLSDADREYALKAAAGDVTMTETAIRRILDINDKAANRVIDKHNSVAKNVKSVVPLTVEKPVFKSPSSGTEGIPGASPSPRNAAPNRTITRTGTMNGRKVNQYSDGSIDYAD